MTTPTPEAIEAAARALYASEWGANANWKINKADDKAYWRMQARVALSAAYPLMEAQAKAEALNEAADAIEHEAPVARHWAAGYLRSRAATIEGKDS